eukprot:Nitzschia sp. Nitz4//scaffold196_size54656//24553//27366//NITZ4_006640-RA/size54656-snap-gene-0.27-mRNA-1//1//CDS//3329540429//7814//frame0
MEDLNTALLSSSGIGPFYQTEAQGIDAGLTWQLIYHQARLTCRLVTPYFEECQSARLFLTCLIFLMIFNACLAVAISYLKADFFNALVARKVHEFSKVLVQNVVLLAVGALVSALYNYTKAQMSVHWREWMTERMLQLYTSERAFYHLELTKSVDNPDQRIAEDIKSLTSFSLQFFVTVLTAAMDLVAFSAILWQIYPRLLFVIILYSFAGTVLTVFFGKFLVALNFRQLSKEADMRYCLMRWRENAEAIAIYGGQKLEYQQARELMSDVMVNQRHINRSQRNLEFFTNLYGYWVQVLPLAVISQRYFRGGISVGTVTQAISAFNHVVKDMCIFVNKFEELSEFAAGVERLASFCRILQEKRGGQEEPPSDELLSRPRSWGNPHEARTLFSAEPSDARIHMRLISETPCVLATRKLTLQTPDGKRELLRDLSISLDEGTRMLVVGESGIGKSSLLRAIAGLWTNGSGEIDRLPSDEVLFLPQRPYCTVGSLKRQLLYPANGTSNNTVVEETVESYQTMDTRSCYLLGILKKVGLLDVATRAGNGDAERGLETVLDWSSKLSLGEQQRLGFARVLVKRPRFLMLDESTSALDEAHEKQLYTLLNTEFERHALTVVSIGHRPTLVPYHDTRLRLWSEDHFDVEILEAAVSIPAWPRVATRNLAAGGVTAWTVIDEPLGPQFGERLQQELQELGYWQRLRPSRTAYSDERSTSPAGSRVEYHASPRARGDSCIFVRSPRQEMMKSHPRLFELWSALQERLEVESGKAGFPFRLDYRHTTIQLAEYPGDAESGYVRHCDSGTFLDNTCGQPVATQGGTPRRFLTAIYYLTPSDWDGVEDAGELRMFQTGGRTVDIVPYSNRLVVFRSDCVQHQVCPSMRRSRRAITFWFCGKER